MKKFSLIFLLFFTTILASAQNGVYVYGTMNNAPDFPVEIEVNVFTDPLVTGYTFTGLNNEIQMTFIELPSPDWTTLIASFIDCNGNEIVSTVYNNDTFPLVDIFLEFDYCESDTIYGCTDPAAINYNPEAYYDDGSCIFEDPYLYVSPSGDPCYVFFNLYGIGQNAPATWYFGDNTAPIEAFTSVTHVYENSGYYEVCAVYTDYLGNLTEACESFEVVGCNTDTVVYGCTYETALNYNPFATVDDGSCVFDAAENDLCANAITLQPGTILIDNTYAIQNEDVWGECWAFGSGEGEQSSIWYSFVTPDEPASIYIEAVSDQSYTLTDTQFGLFEECGGEMIYCDGNSGAGLLSAFSFACGELEENTEYILMIDGYYGDAGTCFLNYDVQVGCDTLVYGCTDPFALNYNPLANIEDGSCQYIDSCSVNLVTTSTSCDFFTICAYLDGTTELVEGNWFVNGLLYEDNLSLVNFVFDEAGVYEICFVADGICPLTVESCTSVYVDPSCFNDCPELFIMPDSTGCGAWHYVEGGNPNEFYTWYFGDGSSIEATSGVYHEYGLPGTYNTCVSFEPTANCQAEEICGYAEVYDCDIIYGCTDPIAINFNPLATIDNGTCQYDSLYCYAYIDAYQLDCNAYSFTAFLEGQTQLIDGYWTLNGNPVSDNSTVYTFFAEEPGDYEICFESYSPFCEIGIYECITVTIEEDCFTDCPELYVYNDSLNCSVDFELSGVSPNETVIWYIDDNPAITAGPYLNYIFNQSDYYTYCAVYDGGNCDEIEFCGTVYVTGCDDDVYGCTDPLAVNYDPLATMDNGTCEYDSIYCYPYVIADQFDCNAYSFYAFIEGPVMDIPGFWSVNGVLVEYNTSIFTFIAEEPGDYEICFESYSDVCQMGIFECEIITVTEDCFTDCPELIIYNDTLNCSVDMELSGVSPNETVIWYIDGNAAITAGPYLNYIFSESGYHSFCAVYEGGECDVIEFCDQVYISGCDEDIYGCTDPEAENYNPFATIDDGTCTYEECDANLVSIMLATSNWGYEISWNIYNSEGITVASGDGYQTDQTYFETACLEDGCYVLEMLDTYGDGWNGGIITMTLNNETIMSGTLDGGYSGFIEFGVNDSDCITTIYGCTDPTAINYNPEATIDDGSCQYNSDCDATETVLLFNNSQLGYGYWELQLDGNTVAGDSIYTDFHDSTICLEDGCYTLSIFMDGGNGQNGFFTVWLGEDLGANDMLANGWSSFELSVGGACDEDIYGCTDPEATNYNPFATIDDGSCYYDFNCNIGFTIYPDSTGENTLWVVPNENIWDATSILWTFGDGESSSELFPEHEYTEDGPFTLCVTAVLALPNGGSCQATFCAIVTAEMLGSGLGGSNGGFFLNIVDEATLSVENEDPFGDLNIWPNPANNWLNIKFETRSNDDITLSIMDLTGKVVYNEIIGGTQDAVSNEIDIQNLANGMYMVSLQNESGINTKRFVVSR